MRSLIPFLVVASAVVLAPAAPCFAFELRPMSRVFATSGSNATQSFEVVNRGADRVALEVTVVSLERDESYVETNHGADDDFLVYPSQIVLRAGATQAIRVSWLGEPNLARERTYRIVVSELPIEVVSPPQKGAPVAVGKMRIFLTYKGTLFIRPAGAAPRVAVGQAVSVTGADGVPSLALSLENSGSSVGLVRGCAVRLQGAGQTIDVAPAALAPLKNTRILAGSRRRYLLAWPPSLPVGPVTATARCDVEP